MTSKDKKISFVGVGRMGANMARNLRDRGYDLGCVYDSNTEIAAELARELECSHAQSLSELTEKSDIVLTVVTDDAAMDAIFFGPGDNLFKGAKNTLFINCATLSPMVHLKLICWSCCAVCSFGQNLLRRSNSCLCLLVHSRNFGFSCLRIRIIRKLRKAIYEL